MQQYRWFIVNCRCWILTTVSTCFGHLYAHHQEKRPRVTAYGVHLLIVLNVAVCGTVVLRCRVWAHTLQEPSQCSHPTATFTVLTLYSNLHSAHTLQQPSQCSHPTATFTVLTPYSNLHSAHTLQQPSQCSHSTATFTVLTPYSNLHIAHTLQQPSQCSHPTATFTVLTPYNATSQNRYQPHPALPAQTRYAVIHGLCSPDDGHKGCPKHVETVVYNKHPKLTINICIVASCWYSLFTLCTLYMVTGT